MLRHTQKYIFSFSLALLMFLVFSLTGCSGNENVKPNPSPAQTAAALQSQPIQLTVEKKPKYIFLFIGDGMGFAHKTLASDFLGATTGKSTLISDTFPVQNKVTTYCLNNKITDSAAAGTALATGNKTNTGMVSYLPDKTKPKTVVEAAKANSLSTGIITTAFLEDATPAVFATHVPSRTQYSDIALQMSQSGVDYIAGGGLEYFIPKGYANGELDSTGAKVVSGRNDATNLVEEYKKSGYNTFTGKDGSTAFESYKPKQGDKVFASFANNNTPFQLDKKSNTKDNTPELSEMVDKAISLLSANPKGFFLMTEGGLIDKAAHMNDAADIINDTIAFEKAIGEAYAFYLKHPSETLIIVTADHETGGLSYKEPDASVYKNETISIYRLGLAYNGNHDDFLNLVSQRLGLKNLTDKEKASIKTAMELADKGKTSSLYGGYSPPAVAASKVLNARAGLKFTSYYHTAAKVPVSVIGPDNDNFKNIKDNTEIGKELLKLVQ